MLSPKVGDRSSNKNANRDLALAKDSAVFNYYPPQGDSKGLFYPNTQEKMTWDSLPDTLTAGQTGMRLLHGVYPVYNPTGILFNPTALVHLKIVKVQ
jgi:hypothetical protein